MAKRLTGFTIVELLIVVVVIAILAAISVVGYSGIQNRAYDSTVQNDLALLAKKYEHFKTMSSNDRYPFGNVPLEALDFKLGNKNAYAVHPRTFYNLLNCTSTALSGTNYALLAISKSGKQYYVMSGSGKVTEYVGGTWSDLTMCTTVLAGSAGNGAGYAQGDSPQWRTWVGSN